MSDAEWPVNEPQHEWRPAIGLPEYVLNSCINASSLMHKLANALSSSLQPCIEFFLIPVHFATMESLPNFFLVKC